MRGISKNGIYRALHTTTAFGEGQFLIYGGIAPQTQTAAEGGVLALTSVTIFSGGCSTTPSLRSISTQVEPPVRAGHVAVLQDHRILVHGGCRVPRLGVSYLTIDALLCSAGDLLSDLWAFDTQNLQWSELSASIPGSARWLHTAVQLPTRRLLMAQGVMASSTNGSSLPVLEIDTETNPLSVQSFRPAPGSGPLPRGRLLVTRRGVFLASAKSFPDRLVTYQRTNNTWEELPAPVTSPDSINPLTMVSFSLPSPRSGVFMIFGQVVPFSPFSQLVVGLGEGLIFAPQNTTFCQFSPVIATGPPARCCTSIVTLTENTTSGLSPVRFMFGGSRTEGGGPYVGLTWLLRGEAWFLFPARVSPLPRAKAAMIEYDNQVFLHG